MRGSDDVVLWVLRLVVDTVPGISSNTIIAVERNARLHWGGRRVYVAKGSPAPASPRRARRG